MTVFNQPNPPTYLAPRPVAVIQREISANAAEQQRILESYAADKASALNELRQRQKALYTERDRARRR